MWNSLELSDGFEDKSIQTLSKTNDNKLRVNEVDENDYTSIKSQWELI